MAAASPDFERTSQTGETSPELQNFLLRLSQKISCMEQMGYQLTLGDAEQVATVRMPGLSAESYDRDDNPKITSLMHLVSSMGFFGYHKPIDKSGHTFCDYTKLFQGAFAFMASSEIEIDEAMYDNTISKWPLDFTFHLGYVGNSSLNKKGVLTAASNGQKLLCINSQVVYINKTTRRPMPLPDWWKEIYANVAIGNEPLKVQKTSRLPATHILKMNVTWSDTDCYSHASWMTYVQFCVNAIHDGIRKGVYASIDSEMVRKGLRKIRMGFVGENLEGDELTVHSWESVEGHSSVCCEIENSFEKPVFHATLYYP